MWRSPAWRSPAWRAVSFDVHCFRTHPPRTHANDKGVFCIANALTGCTTSLCRKRPSLSSAASDLNTYRVQHGNFVNLVKLVVHRHVRD
eukprot:3406702-Pleurochrysis_carterae.AAC.1